MLLVAWLVLFLGIPLLMLYMKFLEWLEEQEDRSKTIQEQERQKAKDAAR